MSRVRKADDAVTAAYVQLVESKFWIISAERALKQVHAMSGAELDLLDAADALDNPPIDATLPWELQERERSARAKRLLDAIGPATKERAYREHTARLEVQHQAEQKVYFDKMDAKRRAKEKRKTRARKTRQKR